MDRLDAMNLFVAAVDEGSLAAAARRSGRSPAAVTRAVALLEHWAGTTLLLRSTRTLSLTAAGERHLAIWREVLLKLDDVSSVGTGAELKGDVVVTAPELFGRIKLLPFIESFMESHTGVAVRALFLNRVVNLVGEGVDLAVRIAPLPDSTLSAIKVGQVRVVFCAAPDYLAKREPIVTPADLASHSCVGLNAESDADLWPFREVGERLGAVRSRRVVTRLSVNQQSAVIDAALRGQGIICARSYQVAEHIAAGRLVRILQDAEPSPVPVHMVFSADRARRGAVRTFIDHASEGLKRELAQVERKIMV